MCRGTGNWSGSLGATAGALGTSNFRLQEDANVNIVEFAIRLGAALLTGAAVGLERQWRHRMAGTRTTALVAAGTAAFAMRTFCEQKWALARKRPHGGAE